MDKEGLKHETNLTKLLTYKEAAEILQLSEITLRIWVSKGILPHLKIGRSVRFTPQQLREFLDSCTREVQS